MMQVIWFLSACIALLLGLISLIATIFLFFVEFPSEKVSWRGKFAVLPLQNQQALPLRFCNGNLRTRPAVTIGQDTEQSLSVKTKQREGIFSSTFEELAAVLGGTGRAKMTWEMFRQGIDPCEENSNLGGFAKAALREVFNGGINSLGQVSDVNVAADGTAKLLVKLHDGLEVETVVIPWGERGSTGGRSTLCVSSQVGCRQGCTFCATGRMGKLRSLSADEILVQMFHAARFCVETGTAPVENVGESSFFFSAFYVCMICILPYSILISRHDIS